MNKEELIKRDDLIYLIEKIDQYLYTDDAGDSDNIKWNKNDILTHADIILKHYNLRYENSSVYYDVENNTHKVNSFIQDLNTGEIVVRYEYTVNAYDYNTTNDVSNRTLTDLHKLLTNYMDYFYENVEEFNIHSIIGGILDTLNNYNNCNIKDKQFVINDFNRYKTICDEEGIYITYSISHFDATHITIRAKYSQNGYTLRSNVKKIKLGGEYIPHNIAWAKLHCLREVLLLLTYNDLK